MQHRSGALETRKSVSKKVSGGRKKGLDTKRPKQVSQHHQLQLLLKSIKKAKQFELRKLIRRLKSVTPATAGAQVCQPKDAEAASKLQSQYDATKHLRPEIALQQAAARCNLQPPTGSGEVSTDLPHSASDRLTQLACSRLLAATCVKQQIQAITDLQQQSCQPAAGGTDSKHGKHSLDSNLLEHSSQSSQGSESEALIQDGRASDVQAAAQEDKQLAEHAIARLLSSRATRPQDEEAVSSADDLSDNAQSSQETSSMPDVSTRSGRQPAPNTDAQSMPTASQSAIREEGGGIKAGGNSKLKGGGKAKLKLTDKGVPAKKKKKNRLGQRARQQLGRVAQAHTMGFIQSRQHVKPNPSAAVPMTTAEPKPTRGLMSKPLANQTASSRTGQSAPLHPSWAAKQMQKQALLTAAPAGRKKVFSDNGQTVTEALSAAVPVKQPTSADAKSEPGGRARGSSTAEALHPSWAAKRAASAQKVDLTSAPKARKIVFDQ